MEQREKELLAWDIWSNKTQWTQKELRPILSAEYGYQQKLISAARNADYKIKGENLVTSIVSIAPVHWFQLHD